MQDDPNRLTRVEAEEPERATPGENEPLATDDTPVVDAAQLFGRHRQVVIGHNGSRYVLRITRHGKLILNK